MSTYKDLVESAPVVMMEFYAQWCQHCQRMKPVIDELKELIGDSAEIYQIDIDVNREIADGEEITGTPTFIIYRDGVEVWRNSGEMDGNILLEKIQHYLRK